MRVCMMKRAFSLKFNYKCSPPCKWVYFSSLSVSFFFPFAPFHFACPQQPIMRVHVMNSKSLAWQLQKEKEKKNPAIPNTHLIFFTTKWLLLAQRWRQRERNNKGLQLPAVSDFPVNASNTSTNSKRSFSFSAAWLTLAQRRGGRPVNRWPPPHLSYVA